MGGTLGVSLWRKTEESPHCEGHFLGEKNGEVTPTMFLGVRGTLEGTGGDKLPHQEMVNVHP